MPYFLLILLKKQQKILLQASVILMKSQLLWRLSLIWKHLQKRKQSNKLRQSIKLKPNRLWKKRAIRMILQISASDWKKKSWKIYFQEETLNLLRNSKNFLHQQISTLMKREN
ncbi:Uncharacterised protein [Mycobacteroides abscessus subsp. abscessus]|nr:Uncharacterised protein [Mycobacteroides abscessus subsp. abscessus]